MWSNPVAAARLVCGWIVLCGLVGLSACAVTPNRADDLGSVHRALVADMELPPEIGVRITDEGPVFTDARGMTLYWSNLDDKHPGRSHCNARYPEPAENFHPLLHVYAQNYRAVPCTKQWPPAYASADAKPVGDWSIIIRDEDGSRQWAYKNYPMHTSYKDTFPGDVNGAVNNRMGSMEQEYQSSFSGTTRWFVGNAPMKLPPGVSPVNRVDLGTIAMTHTGPLYVLNPPAWMVAEMGARPGRVCDEQCLDRSGQWVPFTAGLGANPFGHWGIVQRADGSSQWTYRGQPLYRYREDQGQGQLAFNGIATGYLLNLIPRSPPPPQIRSVYTGVGRVFTNEAGMTLYSFLCDVRAPGSQSHTEQRFVCNGWSDDVAFREQFCAAPDRCAERWRPNIAPADTEPRPGTWSVAVIPDPEKYPLRYVPVGHPDAQASGAVKVWTQRGVPTYLYVEDQQPGDFRGHHIFHNSGMRWVALMTGLFHR